MSNRPLWAPWRIEYILSAKEGGCFLCAMLTAAESEDRNHLLLYRGKTCAVTLNRYPYTGGHLMVFPKRHIAELEALTAEEAAEMHELTVRAIKAIKATMNPDALNVGFNLGAAAGAGLKDHLHQHIVPRWTGDTNFMPVLSDTRCIPQSLESVYDLLKPAFESTLSE
jgi:ATP adenylyltransferase